MREKVSWQAALTTVPAQLGCLNGIVRFSTWCPDPRTYNLLSCVCVGGEAQSLEVQLVRVETVEQVSGFRSSRWEVESSVVVV